ncbi:hypothetical protein [Streptomyces sp. RPT161]|uniref:hypothetical protein n=1 Tax=Streptomyces sp. RPT161 TaxID=3015993 RepID=UPI0022B8DB73|nr:hypothetical protein [Streptomyces sp. RPT161]
MTRPVKVPVVLLHCPSCRTARRCKPIGVATIGRRRREVLECTADDCGLQWVPARTHIPNTAETAA